VFFRVLMFGWCRTFCWFLVYDRFVIGWVWFWDFVVFPCYLCVFGAVFSFQDSLMVDLFRAGFWVLDIWCSRAFLGFVSAWVL